MGVEPDLQFVYVLKSKGKTPAFGKAFVKSEDSFCVFNHPDALLLQGQALVKISAHSLKVYSLKQRAELLVDLRRGLMHRVESQDILARKPER